MTTGGNFLIFLSAAFLLAISTGPGILYVLARSLKGGKKVGMASSFGTALGGMGHVMAAAFGLSAILARSAHAFLFVKYLGAAYLVYLGIRTLLSGDAVITPWTMLLGAISIALNTSADMVVVLAAALLAKRLEASILWRRRQRQVSGAALISLGDYVAVS